MRFALLVASRLLARERKPPAWTKWSGALGAGVVGLGLGIHLAGESLSPGLVALIWVAAGLGSVAGLSAWLRPMLVVAVLGSAVGVSSLFIVLGVASGVEQSLVRSMARLNGHAMITKYGLDFFEYDDVARTLVADERIRAASPFVFGVGMAVAVGTTRTGEGDMEGEPIIVTIKGMDPKWANDLTGIHELFGVGGLESLRPAGPRTKPGIVVGTRLARRLAVDVGDHVRVVVPEAIRPDAGVGDQPRHGEFEVLGLLDTGFAEFDATLVLVHITAAQALVFGEMRASGIELELGEPELGTALAVAEDLQAQLDADRIARGRPPHYRAATWFERSEQLAIVRQVRVLLIIVLGSIVVVASSSLVAALLVLLRGKRRHLGVFAALGARAGQIGWAFEFVGLAVGSIGGILGLVLGAFGLFLIDRADLGLDPTIYMIDRIPVAFVGRDILVPAALAFLVCAGVSGPIARRASRLRPMEMLIE